MIHSATRTTATTPRARDRRWALALAALMMLGLLAPPATAARSPYAQGDEVLFTGLVTDAAGRPLPDLQITLEASRAAFNFKKLGRVRENTRKLATVTDERGEYSLPWRWDDYFNRFDLVVAVAVRTADGEELVELQRIDISRRTQQGSPVVNPVQLQDTELVESRQQFLAALDSEDERKVYEQAGQPERLDRVRFPDYEEVTWWYFRHGRAYRFHDGTLRQVIPFDPVEPFAP
jgi:hypothetical protein